METSQQLCGLVGHLMTSHQKEVLISKVFCWLWSSQPLCKF